MPEPPASSFVGLGADMVGRVRRLVERGNARRLVLRRDGRTVVETPLTVGVVGALIAPQVAALGAIALYAGNYSLNIEPANEDGSNSGSPAPPAISAEAVPAHSIEPAVRAYFRATAENDPEGWDRVCDPGMTLSVSGFPMALRGLSAVKQFHTMLRIAFPDLNPAISDLTAQGDTATVVWSATGTHTGPLLSPMGIIAPTGRVITLEATSTVRVERDLVIEERLNTDIMGLLQQLGVGSS